MLLSRDLESSLGARKYRKVFVLEYFRRDLAFAVLEASRLIDAQIIFVTWTRLTDEDRTWVEAFGAKVLVFFPIVSRFSAQGTEARSLFKKALGLLLAAALCLRIGRKRSEFLLVNNSFLLSRGIALLWRIGLVKLRYIPHGLHPSNSRFVGDSILHFARVDLQHCLDRGTAFAKPIIRRVPYIQSIYRANEIVQTRFSRSRQPQVTFLGGFEVDLKLDAARITAYVDVLNALYGHLRTLCPKLSLIYRPHPSHLIEFRKFSETRLHWQMKPQSLTDDLLSSVAVLSYVSSGLVEAQDLGLPVAQIGTEGPTKVLEFDQNLLDIPTFSVPEVAAEWVQKNVTSMDVDAASEKLLRMTLALASGIWEENTPLCNAGNKLN